MPVILNYIYSTLTTSDDTRTHGIVIVTRSSPLHTSKMRCKLLLCTREAMQCAQVFAHLRSLPPSLPLSLSLSLSLLHAHAPTNERTNEASFRADAGETRSQCNQTTNQPTTRRRRRLCISVCAHLSIITCALYNECTTNF